MAFVSTRADNQNCSLTIYNDGFAVVKERRRMEINEGDQVIHYLDVAKLIETDSLLIEGLTVLELNYEYDLVSKAKLMEKYLDQTIYILDKKRVQKIAYRLLSILDGIVAENVETKEIVINPEGEIILPKLPKELIIRPGLIWQVSKPKPSDVKVSYITKGFSWTTDYVLHLKEQMLDLSGWVNIKNESGTTFADTELKLIAGNVKRVATNVNNAEKMLTLTGSLPQEQFEEKSFNDYHLYTCERRTTLKNQQTKQIHFLHFQDIACNKFYQNRYGNQVNIQLSFINEAANGIGVPLPKGKIKVYAKDQADQSLEFIGEDQIAHTPKDEKVILTLGNAFDVICEEQGIEQYEKLGYRYASYTFEIRNHKKEAIDFQLSRYIYGRNCKIVKANHPYEIKGQEIVFKLNLNASEQRKVTFTHRYKQ